MKKSYYLNEPEGIMMFMMAMIFAAANILLKIAVATGVYLYLTRYTSLETRQMAALSAAIIIADKFWIRFKLDGKETA